MHFKSNRTDLTWNKKTNFITTCLNFRLKLIEHIRNKNSVFVGLVYKSAFWLRLCIRFYNSGKGKQKYQKCRIVQQNKVYIELIGILIPSIVFYGFQRLAL